MTFVTQQCYAFNFNKFPVRMNVFFFFFFWVFYLVFRCCLIFEFLLVAAKCFFNKRWFIHLHHALSVNLSFLPLHFTHLPICGNLVQGCLALLCHVWFLCYHSHFISICTNALVLLMKVFCLSSIPELSVFMTDSWVVFLNGTRRIEACALEDNVKRHLFDHCFWIYDCTHIDT